MKHEYKSLINAKLVEIDTQALLLEKFNKQVQFIRATKEVALSEVPIVSSKNIEPGVRYRSSSEGKSDFFIPKYILKSTKGQYATRMQLFPSTDDPSQPVGQLTVEVQSIPLLNDSSRNIRVMPHDLLMRLGYHIPIEETASASALNIEGFHGEWLNTDADTDGVISISIFPQDDAKIKVHAMQACSPKPCDLGVVSCDVIDGSAVALFRRPDKTTSLTLMLESDELNVIEFTDIHSSENASDFSARHSFRRANKGTQPPLIWFELSPPTKVSNAIYRSVTPIQDMDTYVRLHRVMTSSEHLARIEIKSQASVGRRSIKQVFVGHKNREKLLEATKKKSFLLDHKDAKKITQGLERHGSKLVPNIKSDAHALKSLKITKSPTQARMNLATSPSLHKSATLLVPTAAVHAQTSAKADRKNLVLDINTKKRQAKLRDIKRKQERLKQERLKQERLKQERLKQERLKQESLKQKLEQLKISRTLDFSRLNYDPKQFQTRKLPSWIMVENNGEPVLTRRQASCTQLISPVWVDQQKYQNQIEAPAVGDAGLVLLRQEIRDGEQAAIFYQDALTPAQIYYEPQEFRLARSEEAPFAPMMLFHLDEVVGESDNAEAGAPEFTVTMTYQARPYIHSRLLNAAQQHFGDQALIAPIVPSISSLTIRLPSTDIDNDNELTRDDVEVDFSDGISDMITFSENEFRRLTSAFQTVSGIGLEGHVSVSLLDGGSAQIPLRIGLKNTVGEVFSSSVKAEQSDNAISYALKNRIESPVKIESFPVMKMPDGTRALPLTPPPTEPVGPAESITVDYSLAEGGAHVDDTLTVNDVSVEPNMLAILSQTTVVQGFDDDTFDIVVSIDPMFFEFVPVGAEPITRVEIRFKTSEDPVILTAEQPRLTVSLKMPKLLFLTNSDEAEYYSYSVKDFHGDTPGLVTAFRPGSGNLDIQPALAEIGGE